MEWQRVIIIGCGGIGTNLLYSLCRLLNDQHFIGPVILIDGKSFRKKNRSRQHFQNLGNKAEVKMQELQQQFGQLMLKAVAENFTSQNAFLYVRNGDCVFVAPDNHYARRLACERAQLPTISNILLISGSNDIVNGRVMVYYKKAGKDLVKPFIALHPEIAQAQAPLPAVEACDEQPDQILPMNMLVAAYMLVVFFKALQGHSVPEEINVDMNPLGMSSLFLGGKNYG